MVLNLIITLGIIVLVGCRPASEVIDKSSKTESVTYQPGSKITVAASDTENPIPLITADPSSICRDLSFYDPNGTLLQGTRNCTEALANCEQDGDIDCRATAANPSVVKAALEAKIIAGESIAGVEGTANNGEYSVCTGAGQSACIATTTYKTMDLSLADSSTDLTAANFNNSITTAGNFEFWDASGQRHVLGGDSNLTALNIKSGITVFGISGSLSGAPPSCSSDGEASCIVDGTNYRAAAIAGAASKILSGQSLAGVSGNVTLPAQGSVLSGTSYGVNSTGATGTLTLPAVGNVLSGSGTYGNPSSPLTPSYSPDFPAVGNVLSTDTVNGASGTLTLPNAGDVEASVSYGVGGNGSTGTFVVPGAANVASGVNYGADGTEFSGTADIESHTDCTGAGQTGCVATATYATMDLSNKDAGGALNLNSTDFNTRITSASLFEYWDENGTRYTANGDADINATNIKSSIDIFGASGSVAEAPANCSSDGSQDCVATGSYYAASACSADASNCFVPTYVATMQPLKAISFDAIDTGKASIRSSLTLSGVTGTLADCSSDGGVGCVVVGPSYAAAVTTGAADKILSGQSLAGVSGNATLPTEGKVLTGTSYGVNGTGSSGTLTLPDANDVLIGSGSYGDPGSAITPSFSPDFPDVSNVLGSDTVNSVSGTLTLPAEGKVLTGTSYGVAGNGSTGTLTLPNDSNVLTGSGPYGDPDAAVTPSYSPDFPDLANVRSGDTVNGANGTLADCSGAGQASCVATATYATMDLSNKDAGGALNLNSTDFNTRITSASLFEYWDENGTRYTANGDADIVASNIKSSVDIFGATGSMMDSPANCSSNGSQNCVAAGSYYAATDCASNGGDTCYLNPAGSFDAADLSNLAAGNIKRGVTIAGMTGNFPSTTNPLPRYSDSGATTNTTGADETDLTNFITQMTSAGSFEYWDSSGVRRTGSGDADITDANVKSGIMFENLSITGSAPEPPCNYGDQGTCEADTACRWTGAVCELNPWHIRKGITIGGQTGNITFHKNMVDTATYNRSSGDGGMTVADVFDTIDDYNNNGSFPTTAPGDWDQATGANWTEVVASTTYKDEITGLVWTDDQGSLTWENAIIHCSSLTYGGQSDWRLPTQKELQQAYVDGIWSKKPELSLLADWYWSASSRSTSTTNAWIVSLLSGETYYDPKTNSRRVACVDGYTSIQCLSNADCNDGLYCNGTETCNLSTNSCQAGTAVSCSTNYSCDEPTDSCVYTGGGTFNGLQTKALFASALALDKNALDQLISQPLPASIEKGIFTNTFNSDTRSKELMTYLVRCALPASEKVVVPGTSNEMAFMGDSGFAPEWQHQACDSACQEKVSSCLYSMTNAAGMNVFIQLGQQTESQSLLRAEGMYFGNFFAPSRTAFACRLNIDDSNAAPGRVCALGGCEGITALGSCNALCQMESENGNGLSCKSPGDRNFKHPLTVLLP